MVDKPTSEDFCPKSFARDVSFDVLHEFTEACPDVKMSYEDWTILRCIIEDTVGQGLGVPSEEDETAEKPTVQ